MSEPAVRDGWGRRSRAPRGQGGRLRQEILEATERLLLETGDQDAVSIRAVAESVGISPPSIYMHFSDKLELIFAVCQRHLDDLDRLLSEAAAGVTDPVEALRRRGRAYVGFGLDQPEVYRILFMIRPTASPPDWLHSRLLESAAFLHTLEVVQAALDAGAIQTGPAELVAVGLWAAIHGLTSLLIAKPDLFGPGGDETLEYLLDVLIAGITAPPAPR
ncbi:MAG: TetR/AcrR family transcriptional regulator [Acidimicrobiales bacterium]